MKCTWIQQSATVIMLALAAGCSAKAVPPNLPPPEYEEPRPLQIQEPAAGELPAAEPSEPAPTEPEPPKAPEQP